MNKVFNLILTLSLLGCGKSGTFTGSALPRNPSDSPISSGPYNITLLSTRNPDNSSNNGTYNITTNTNVTLPDPSSIIITSNASDFYHVSLLLGSVSCDYIHDAQAGGLRYGAGCTTNSVQTTLKTGDIIQLSIGSNVDTPASIQVQLVLQNL